MNNAKTINYPKKMGKIFYFLLICALVLLYFNCNPVFAYSNTHQIGITSDELGIAGVATAKIDYNLEAEVKHDDDGESGQSQTWDVNMKNGKIGLSLNVAGQHMPITQDLILGKRIDINAAPGIKVNLFTTATAPIIVSGPAHTNKNNLEWSSAGPQSFTLFISDSAQKGDKVEIRLPVKIKVNIGLTIDLLVLKKEISSIPIGSFDVDPQIVETIEIGKKTYDFSLPIIVGILAGVGGIIGVLLIKKRKTG